MGMSTTFSTFLPHPEGEQPPVEEFSATAETFAGRVHVEWDSDGLVTPLGQLPFFVEYLKQAGLFASGWSPVYPCHVPARDMRQHPIGTGPFKFVEFKPNQSITLARSPDYWKPGRPYVDGIEWTIVRDVSTRLLSFIAG
jgi:ABC-type transport system substrate-binding protein